MFEGFLDNDVFKDIFFYVLFFATFAILPMTTFIVVVTLPGVACPGFPNHSVFAIPTIQLAREYKLVSRLEPCRVHLVLLDTLLDEVEEVLLNDSRVVILIDLVSEGISSDILRVLQLVNL